jgi:hypothetical protein
MWLLHGKLTVKKAWLIHDGLGVSTRGSNPVTGNIDKFDGDSLYLSLSKSILNSSSLPINR